MLKPAREFDFMFWKENFPGTYLDINPLFLNIRTYMYKSLVNEAYVHCIKYD